MTPAELEWFSNLRKDYPDLHFDLWSYSKVKDLLTKHYRIFYDYFPIPEHVRIEIDQHLTDLKRDVVLPLINSVRKCNLRGIRAITNTELCKDMFHYHCPQADIKLQAFIESSNRIESQSKELYNRIKALLRKYLQAHSVDYRESDGTQYAMTNSIPIEQFAERLWPLIESKSYDDDKISMDRGYPTMLRIRIENTVGQGIMYQCLPSEDCHLIMKTLQSICNTINSDINNELSEYNENKSNRKTLAKDLLLHLDHLKYANKLGFEELDVLKCIYIDY
ncbi:MAG: hypothetical protein WAM14_04850 [Candidatus Nitrosopolaris sp.]